MVRKVKGSGSDSYREAAVQECYNQRPDEVHFIRSRHNGEFDRGGVDFVVRLLAYPFSIELQVLPSDTTNTVGVVLPLSGDLDERTNRYMRRSAEKQRKKHPHIQCILFIGGWRRKGADESRRKNKKEVIYDIWLETEKIFKIVSLRTEEL